MKKKIILSLIILIFVTGCTLPNGNKSESQVLTMWTYRIGDWSNKENIQELIGQFEKENKVSVNIEYIDYITFEHKINEAKENNSLPDIIFSRPEDVVSYARNNCILLDLTSLYDENDKKEIYSNVVEACKSKDWYYFYPLSATVYTMALNKDALIESGCYEKIKLKKGFWTSEDFFETIDIMYKYYGKNILSLYCEGQGGDYGVRSLYKNLYDGDYMDDTSQLYTMDNYNIVRAIRRIIVTNGIEINPSLSGGDAIVRFMENEDKMVLCWDVNLQLLAEKNLGFEVVYVPFPSDGNTRLYSEIYGYSLVDSGDRNKIEKSKNLVKFLADSSETANIIKTTKSYPVRDYVDNLYLGDIWSEDETMSKYGELIKYSEKYEQIAKNYDRSRVQAFKMFQNICNGYSLNEAIKKYQTETNNKD